MNYFYLLLGVLLIASVVSKSDRFVMKNKKPEDWLIDLFSQLMHFFIIPALQVALVFPLYSFLFPSLKSSVEINWLGAILFNMFVDYTWYWNHRALHARTKFWNLHALHHEPSHLDIFATPKNSFLSPFFMSYFWLLPFAIYISLDPAPLIAVASFSLFINFWGHTQLNFNPQSKIKKFLSVFLIQPEDHFWHHSNDCTSCNFGTVFNFWDKIHGTWHRPNYMPLKLGFKMSMPSWRKVFWPF